MKNPRIHPFLLKLSIGFYVFCLTAFLWIFVILDYSDYSQSDIINFGVIAICFICFSFFLIASCRKELNNQKTAEPVHSANRPHGGR
jgi:low affinity Fe/Cu permease